MNNLALALVEMIDMSDTVLLDTYKEFVQTLAYDVEHADYIVGLGAGRMGYSLRAFIMRLNHMGYNASMIGDTNVPRVTDKSLVIINTSSGETPSMILYAKQAIDEGATVVVLTTNRKSSLAILANYVFIYAPKDEFKSKQIMKTAYEQFSYILLDAFAADIVEINGVSKAYMEHNHSILE
jgi:6-phospho-3-hexuloisomerase